MSKEKTTDGIKIPYVLAYSCIGKTLNKIVQAATPERFTQDFLSTKLGIKGGTAKSVIPFLKRIGFLNSDGTPTDLYNKFRNETFRKIAAADAIRRGFGVLYEMHEYVHDLQDKELKALIVQATGVASDSSTARAILGSFKELKQFADFNAEINDSEPLIEMEENDAKNVEINTDFSKNNQRQWDMKLGYTINLNLPASTDIAVYNAIFKSLRDHLLNQ